MQLQCVLYKRNHVEYLLFLQFVQCSVLFGNIFKIIFLLHTVYSVIMQLKPVTVVNLYTVNFTVQGAAKKVAP